MRDLPEGYVACAYCSWAGPLDRYKGHFERQHGNLKPMPLVEEVPVEKTKGVPRKSEFATEKEFQAAAEAWLDGHGYWRMTATSFITVSSAPLRGFYGHWPKAWGNPFCADLLVWAWPNVRPPLWIELKVKAKYQPGQREAIRLGAWKECWTLAEVQSAVNQWEVEQ